MARDQVDHPAAKLAPRQAPTPSPSNDVVSDSPSLQGSLIVCCLQYRQAQNDKEMIEAEKGSKQQMADAPCRSVSDPPNLRQQTGSGAINGK